jgi:hypothetical protein
MPEIAKKSSDEQFLQGSRNWEKCSASTVARFFKSRQLTNFLIVNFRYQVILCHVI